MKIGRKYVEYLMIPQYITYLLFTVLWIEESPLIPKELYDIRMLGFALGMMFFISAGAIGRMAARFVAPIITAFIPDEAKAARLRERLKRFL